MKTSFLYIFTMIILMGCNGSDSANTTSSQTPKTAPGVSTEVQSNYKSSDGTLDVNRYNGIVDNYTKGGGQ